MASQDEISKHLGVSVRHVRMILADLGLPMRNCDLDTVRSSYLAHLREVAAGRASYQGELDLVQERARLAKAQADDKEIDIAIKRGDLVPAQEIEHEWGSMVVSIKLALMALPDRLQRLLNLSDVQRATAENEIRTTLEKLANN